MTVLHVEQEVTGDDTTALDSVLECDFKRHRLLAEEKSITATLQANRYIILLLGKSTFKVTQDVKLLQGHCRKIKVKKRMLKARKD